MKIDWASWSSLARAARRLARRLSAASRIAAIRRCSSSGGRGISICKISGHCLMIVLPMPVTGWMNELKPTAIICLKYGAVNAYSGGTYTARRSGFVEAPCPRSNHPMDAGYSRTIARRK